MVMIARLPNPTGTVMSSEELEAIYTVVSEHGAVLVVDEIYQGLIYANDGSTSAHFGDDMFVINSFSKYFGMTGWRIGWMVAPEAYVSAIDRLAQNIFYLDIESGSVRSDRGIFRQCIELMESRRVAFRERRDYLLPALARLGFNIACVPRGAFYLYADSSKLQ